MRLAGERVNHLLGIPMIGCDHGNAAGMLHRLGDPSQASINVLTGLNRPVEFTGVSHHIRIGKVDDEQVRLAFLDGAQQFFGDLECRHLRLQVISRNPG